MAALPISPLVARYRKPALALVAMAHCGAALAAGAPPDLTVLPFEQLLTMEVYSASKFIQKSSAAPALVTVITAADIRHYGWRTLGDVARSVRGLYVNYDRNYSYLGERGFLRPGDYNTRFLLLVDGNRINDAVYDQAPVGGEFPVDLDLIERIEFVPGPGSSIYGSNAFFGVINVITKKADDLPGTRVSIEAGSAGARKAGASTSWRGQGGSQFLLAASAHRTDGKDLYYREFDTPDQNSGVAQGLDYERGERILASTASGPFSLALMHAQRVKGVPTASFYQPFNDARSKTTDRQTYLNAAWRTRSGKPEELAARLFWGRYDSYGDYVNDDDTHSLNHDGSAARWWGAELSVVSTRFAGHRLLAGLDYQRDYRLHQYTYDLVPYYSYLDDRRAGSRVGVYLQDELPLTKHTLLNLGLRYDHNTGVSGEFSPRAALIHTLSPTTTLKAIYGSAFRAPNAYERYYAFPGPGGQLPNQDLRKERIGSTELALVHQLGERERLTVTVFRNMVTGLISQVGYEDIPETRFENGDRVRAVGVEMEYERRWRSGAALRTSYSFSRAGKAGDGEQLHAPEHLAKFNLAAPLNAGWRAALEGQYVGSRKTRDGAASAFWLVNANLYSAQLLPNTEASFGIYNLFGKRYADPGSTEHRQAEIAQDARALRARIAYAF